MLCSAQTHNCEISTPSTCPMFFTVKVHCVADADKPEYSNALNPMPWPKGSRGGVASVCAAYLRVCQHIGECGADERRIQEVASACAV